MGGRSAVGGKMAAVGEDEGVNAIADVGKGDGGRVGAGGMLFVRRAVGTG